tara:strand:+ start:869 stop:1330 length:462 start_codon:yes stop_codon:yes gene_type:complete
MKSKEIQDIINFIKKTDLDDVSIETENYKIRVKKNKTTYTTTEKVKSEEVKPLKKIEVEDKPEEKKEKKENDTKNIIIKSPMIGTFYRSPNPESGPFISEGDIIKPGQTICIVEAMKLFNEIESEVSGKVVKVIANDSSPIEFDQPLFEVDPS